MQLQEQEWLAERALIRLSRGKSAVVDRDMLPTLNAFKWHFNGHYAVRNKGRGRDRRLVFMHHAVLPRRAGFITDHVNRDGLDNRRANLRYVTHAENMQNKMQRIEDFKGVSKNGHKWRARILDKTLGNFHNPLAAAAAYNAAATHYFGEFASLNEINEFHEWLDELDRDRLADIEKRFTQLNSYRTRTCHAQVK